MRCKFYILAILMWLVGVSAAMAVESVDDVPNVHVANSRRYVSDQAQVFSHSARSQTDAMIDSIWRTTSVEMAVVTVDALPEDTDIDTFATDLFEKWGIGKSENDNGLLIILSRDDRRVALRSGYGLEGVLPDVVLGRIRRNVMTPLLAQDKFDQGLMAGVQAVGQILTDPAVSDEIMAGTSASDEGDLTLDDLFTFYLWFAVAIALCMSVAIVSVALSSRKLGEVERYQRLRVYGGTALFVAFLTMGMGAPAYLWLRWKLQRLRRHKRLCPNCGRRMMLVDEEHDNDFLTPAQDTEERLLSVDYDVWLCPDCRSTEILAYENPSSGFVNCPRCGAKAMSVTSRRTLQPATTRQDGVGEDVMVCRNCGHHTGRRFRIPRVVDDSALVAASVLGAAATRRGGFGGGGFSGGGFGGGHTGGGGTSGGF